MTEDSKTPTQVPATADVGLDSEAGEAAPPERRRRHLPHLRLPLPRTFQGRLSLAFVIIFVLAVGILSALTLYVVDRELQRQDEATLAARARAMAAAVGAQAQSIAANDQLDRTVVSPSGRLNDDVRQGIADKLQTYTDQVALADVRIRFGLGTETAGGLMFEPVSNAPPMIAQLTPQSEKGQSRDTISYTGTFAFTDPDGLAPTWYLEVSLSAPYTSRQNTLAVVVGFLAFTSLLALGLAVLVSALLARRFTAPLRRLTEAARALEKGNLDRRVPTDQARTGASEIAELSRQFNAMADQVQETMAVIVRDRDRSREFLADVSHELRTPIAALRTFNELLQEKAGDDPAARGEFLEASAQQLERLDWLAQNLLELSKLDTGLIKLDLRPDDIRATVQSAVEQAEAAARRRGVSLSTELPDTPLVIRHDPPRVGQIVANLVGNALKFTPRGGSVSVKLVPHRTGARISVTDTGVGIDASELPHIFERFYRGSRANEARGSGSGLGLAIVRSIAAMHGGRISVESRVGVGSTFTVTLPQDPRTPAERAAAAERAEASKPRSASRGLGRRKDSADSKAGEQPRSPQPPIGTPPELAAGSRPTAK